MRHSIGYAFIGIGMASTFATGFSRTETRMVVTNRIASAFIRVAPFFFCDNHVSICPTPPFQSSNAHSSAIRRQARFVSCVFLSFRSRFAHLCPQEVREEATPMTGKKN